MPVWAWVLIVIVVLVVILILTGALSGSVSTGAMLLLPLWRSKNPFKNEGDSSAAW
jgi:hypothetical protein